MVIWNACTVCALVRLSMMAAKPFSNIFQITSATGISSSSVRYARASSRSPQRIPARRTASETPRPGAATGAVTSAKASRPSLQCVEPDEYAERDQQEDRRDGRSAGDVVALQLVVDVHRGDLGLERQVARDQDGRTELAHGAGEGERRPCRHRRDDVRQDDAPEDRRRAGPEGRGGLL